MYVMVSVAKLVTNHRPIRCRVAVAAPRSDGVANLSHTLRSLNKDHLS
jgi:hypothetical protein